MPASTAKPRASPSKDSSPPPGSKDGAKMHRRSRQGCYTCRLRRKKCDEKRDVCGACRNLKIECHYSRPSWWSNADKRAMHKDNLKEAIKKTKVDERPAQSAHIHSPPGLCHSVPSSDHFPDFARARAASTDSHFSPRFDLDTPKDLFTSTPMMPPPQWTPVHNQYPHFAQFPSMPPFEIDVKTEHEMFVNDMSIRKDSTLSTFSAFQESPSIASTGFENWVKHEHSEWFTETVTEEPLVYDLFDFPHSPGSPEHLTEIQVDPADQYLLEHFLNTVAPLVFPILDLNQQATGQRSAILPALETNSSYLHCCLSVAALHLRATGTYAPEQEAHINNAIMDHQWAAVQELVNSIQTPGSMDPSHMLETMLAMIIFESSVAQPTPDMQGIPWHQHLAGAEDVINKLAIMDGASSEHTSASQPSHLSFNASLASWIDILGATMKGRVPLFSESYRHKIEGGIPSGLADLMGCDDRVMYLIAEICSLESLKMDGRLDSMALCGHIASLGEQLGLTEIGPEEVGDVFSPTGAIRPKQLTRNITALYRIAARIYLCSLVPGFDRRQPNIRALVESFASIMGTIPAGPHGHDRSLVWPLLIVGSVCDEQSSFRAMFAERSALLEQAASIGSMGRLSELLADVWKANDAAAFDEAEPHFVHWRDVMAKKSWDILLI